MGQSSSQALELGQMLNEINRLVSKVRIRFYEKYVTKEIYMTGDARHDDRVQKEKDYALMLLNHNHPNVIKTFDVSGTQQYTLIVMEKCECNLVEYLDQKKAIMSDREKDLLMINLIRQIAAGYQFIQKLNSKFIHRDLTADNIFVSFNKGYPIFKIADFGVARNIGESMTQKSLFNQKPMLAPEFQSRHYTQKVDIYSFGVVIWIFLENPVLRQPNTNDSMLFTRTNNLTKLVKQMIDESQTSRISWEKLYSHYIILLKPQTFLDQDIKIGGTSQSSEVDQVDQQQSRIRQLQENLSTLVDIVEFDRVYLDQIIFINKKFEQVRKLDSVFSFEQLYVLGEVWSKIILVNIQKLPTDQRNKLLCLQRFINAIEYDQNNNRLIQANTGSLFLLMSEEDQKHQLKQIILLLNKINSEKYNIIITILEECLKN